MVAIPPNFGRHRNSLSKLLAATYRTLLTELARNSSRIDETLLITDLDSSYSWKIINGNILRSRNFLNS